MMQENKNNYFFTLLILCIYGLFKEIRPSEPYLTDYLIGDQWKNLTTDSVYDQVYPVWPYSYFGLLVPVFLLTDYLRYKPVIVLEGLAYIATWSLLLWAKGKQWMQFMEFTYGMATSTEVAYYTYVYAKVSPDKYKQVSSYARSTLLFGRFVSGLISQLLVSFKILDCGQLNYVSLVSVSLAFFVSLFLPKVNSSIYFHANGTSTAAATTTKHPFYRLWQDLKKAYSNGYVVKWSVWVALATCGNFQIGNYIQTLWNDISPNKDSGCSGSLNGAVEAATTLSGAISVFMVSLIPIDWTKWGNVSIVCCNGTSALLLYFMGVTNDIWVAYIGYLLYRSIYQILMTIASFEIVKQLPRDSYGLVFGFNIFIALGCQTLLTFIINSQLSIDPKPQFVIYGIYNFVLFILYSFYQIKTNNCIFGPSREIGDKRIV